MRTMVVLIMCCVFLLSSCEENFSPKTEFEEAYIASCIIGLEDGNNKFVASLNLASTYDAKGIIPYINNIDPTITEANAILSFPHIASYKLENDTSIFHHPGIPDSIIWADYNRYGNPFVTFSAIEIPIRFSPLNLDVEFPNGDKLTASTEFPRGVFLEMNYDFPHGVTADVNTFKYGNYWEIKWDAEENHMYYITLKLNYQLEAQPDNIYKSIEIPLEFVNNKPVYPKFNYPGNVRYSFESINQVMASLGNETVDSNSIIVNNFILNIIEMNEDLSSYYSSINGFLDEYSVRLDEQIYTNVKGGIGIFGAYKNTEIKKLVDRNYAESFGYKVQN